MNFEGIARYSLRAFAFAAVVSCLYTLSLRLRGRKIALGKLAAVFYISALVEIIALRGGSDWSNLLHAQRPPVEWIPLRTTLAQYRLGAWAFAYHVVGNLAWFAPLGIIMSKRPLPVALAAGFLLSCAVEAAQWALMTGVTDADDLLLNTLGTLIGYAVARFLKRR